MSKITSMNDGVRENFHHLNKINIIEEIKLYFSRRFMNSENFLASDDEIPTYHKNSIADKTNIKDYISSLKDKSPSNDPFPKPQWVPLNESKANIEDDVPNLTEENYEINNNGSLSTKESFPFKSKKINVWIKFGDHKQCIKILSSDSYNWLKMLAVSKFNLKMRDFYLRVGSKILNMDDSLNTHVHESIKQDDTIEVMIRMRGGSDVNFDFKQERHMQNDHLKNIEINDISEVKKVKTFDFTLNINRFTSILVASTLLIILLLWLITPNDSCVICYENFGRNPFNAVLCSLLLFNIVILVGSNITMIGKLKNQFLERSLLILVINCFITGSDAIQTGYMRKYRSWCYWDIPNKYDDLTSINVTVPFLTIVRDIEDFPLCDHKDPHFLETTKFELTSSIPVAGCVGTSLTPPIDLEKIVADNHTVTFEIDYWHSECSNDTFYNFANANPLQLRHAGIYRKTYSAVRRVGGVLTAPVIADLNCNNRCLLGDLSINLTCAEYPSCNLTFSSFDDYCGSFVNLLGFNCSGNYSTSDCIVQARNIISATGSRQDSTDCALVLAQENTNDTYELDYPVVIGFPGAFASPVFAFPSGFHVEITRNNQIVYFRTSDPLIPGENMTAVIRKQRDTDLLVIDTDFYIWPIPSKYFHQSGTMTITVFRGSSIVGTISFNLVAIHSCNVYQCTMCWEAFYNWGCLPMMTKIASVLIILILGMMTCCLLPGAAIITYNFLRYGFYIFGSLANCLWNFSKIPSFRSARYYMGRWGSNIRSSMTPQEEEVGIIKMDDTSFKADKPTWNILDVNHNIKNLIISFILFNVLVTTIKACDSGLVIPASLKDCKKSGKTETCVIDLEVNGIITNLAGSNCFTVSDGTDVLAYITVEYMNLMASVPLIDEYYTSAYDLNYESHRICHDEKLIVDSKCKDSYCTEVANKPEDTSIDGFLKSPMTKNFPGISGCKSASGGWINGCKSFGDSCIIYRWALNPVGEITTVTQPGAVVVNPVIRLNVSSNSVDKSYIYNVQGKVYNSDGFRFTILGTLSAETPVLLTGQKFMKINSNGGVLVVDASETNEASGFGFGAIQSQTVNGLLHPTPNSFTFNTGISTGVSVTSAKRVTIDYTIFNGVDYFSLPSVINGNYWVVGPQGLVSNLTNGGALEYVLETPNGIFVSREISNVCPTIIQASAKGCYACQAGAEILVTAKSTCDQGLAFVSLSGESGLVLFTTTIKLETSETINQIRFSTEEVSNDFTLTLSGEFENSSVDISFVAFTGIVISNETVSGGNGTIIDQGTHQKWDKWITDGFKGIHWLNTLVLYLGIFIIIIIGVTICMYAIRFNRSMMVKKRE